MTKNLRLLVAVSLIVFALLSAVWVLLLPDHVEDPYDSLVAVAGAGGTAKIAVIALALSQLPFMIGVAGVAAWLHPAAPRLAWTGGTMAVLGGFGHAVFSGAEMVRQSMASDPAGNADIAGQVQSFAPLVPFMAAGLLGTVVGLVLLGVAHRRSHAAPRWTGPALLAFVVVEFVGSNVSEWATYLSGLLLLGACAGLAMSVMSGPSAIARSVDEHRAVSDLPTGAGSAT